MPEMGGLELLRKLQERGEGGFIPVIMVTGEEDLPTKEKALQMGAKDFISKPIQNDALLPRVRRVLG